MEFYIAFVILEIFLLCDYKIGGKQKPRFFTYCGVLIAVALCALRFDIGADYSTYYKAYETAFKREIDTHWEPANNLIFHLLYEFKSPALIISFYAVLTTWISLYTIKKHSKSFAIGVLTYLFIAYIYQFSILRQSLAVAIILYAYPFFKSGSKKYYVCVAIASLVHLSSLLSFVFPFLYKHLRAKVLAAIMLISLVFFFIGPSILFKLPIISNYSAYLELLEHEGGRFQALFMLFIVVYLWLFIPKHDKQKLDLFKICAMGSIFPMIFGTHTGGRIAMYFYAYLCLSASDILCRSKLITKAIYVILIAIWFVGYTYISSDGDSKSFIPYQTVFDVDLDRPVFKQ